jgi:hypothetical protein
MQYTYLTLEISSISVILIISLVVYVSMFSNCRTKILRRALAPNMLKCMAEYHMHLREIEIFVEGL